MVSEKFLTNFQKHVHKNLKELLAGTPVTYSGGVNVDHYKGILRGLASFVIPFFTNKYNPTEYVFGWIPIKDPALPLLFFQIPVLNVKGSNYPSVAHFAAMAATPIPETIVAPRIRGSGRFIYLSALGGGKTKPKAAYKAKIGWTPLLKALNKDRRVRRAAWPRQRDTYIASFYIRANTKTPLGLTQLSPYNGFTILMAQRLPLREAAADTPRFHYRHIHKEFDHCELPSGPLREEGGGWAATCWGLERAHDAADIPAH